MRSTTVGRSLFFAICAACVALAGCERAYERVIPPAAENLSRNSATQAQGVDAPRDAAAAAETPPVRPSLPSTEAISDAFMVAKIRASLLADPGMSGSDVSVNAEHGVVVLTGTVKSYEQAGIASAYAQRQEGVMRIDNQLSLAPQ